MSTGYVENHKLPFDTTTEDERMFYDVYCQLCRERGLTPSGAAAQIGFNRASVTVWKNTGKAPKQELLLKIAAFFGVTTDYLLTGRAAPQVPLEQQLEGLDFALFGEVRDMTDAQKRDVLKFMKFIKQKEE